MTKIFVQDDWFAELFDHYASKPKTADNPLAQYSDVELVHELVSRGVTPERFRGYDYEIGEVLAGREYEATDTD